MKYVAVTAQPVSIDEKNRTVRFRFTDETRDDYDTVLTHEGWDFSTFLNNPVVRLDHSREARDIAGRGLSIEEVPEERAHDIVVEFDTDETGEWAFTKVKRGFMRAVSAGFDIIRMDGDKILDKVLREVSLVSVPSNPTTLVRSAKEGEMSTEEAEKMAKRYERSAEYLRTITATRAEKNKEEETMTEEQVKKAIEDAVKPLNDEIETLKTANTELATKADELTKELETVNSKLSEEKPNGDESKPKGSDTKPGNGSGGHEDEEGDDDEIDEEEAKRILEEYDKELDEEFKTEEEKE